MKSSYLSGTLVSLLLFVFILSFNTNTSAQRYWNVAAKFEGSTSSSILVVPWSGLKNLSGSFTAECWFYCEPGGTGTLFGKNGFRLMLESSGDKVRGRMQTNNNTKLYTRTSTAMETNRWYHLACTYDSVSGNMRFYINGILDTTTTGTGWGPRPGTDSLLIGSSIYGSFEGMIDDIRVWNRALTGTEILNNMRIPYVGALNTQLSNFGSGLVMSATFDFTYSGSTSLYFYDGYNSYTNQGASGVDIGMQPSQTLLVNSSLDLTGGGYARMTSNADIEFNGPVTAEAWIYALNPATGTYQQIIRKGSDYSFFLEETGKVRFGFGPIGLSLQTVPANKWTHIAITCAASGIGKIYINGELDVVYNFGSRPTPGTDSLFIGAYNYALFPFNGYIDAVKISNYEKTADDIKKDMFKIVDFSNRPTPPNSTVSLNFDHYNYSSTSTGNYYYLRNNAKYSNQMLSEDVPVSPLVGNYVSYFPAGYLINPSFKRIPDVNTAGYQIDSIEITSTVPIANLKLFVALNHSLLSDLRLTLIAPTGDSAVVWNGNLGLNSKIEQLITVFDDNADSSIISGKYTDMGPTIKPYVSLASAFSGKNPQGTWRLRITDFYNGNTGYLYAWGLRINNSVGVEENYSEIVPENFVLEQNYPNPFNPATNIKFSLPVESRTRLVVYDILGNKVATLIDDIKPAGSYTLTWDGTNDQGIKISSGVYIYRLETENFIDVKKMLMLK